MITLIGALWGVLTLSVLAMTIARARRGDWLYVGTGIVWLTFFARQAVRWYDLNGYHLGAVSRVVTYEPLIAGHLFLMIVTVLLLVLVEREGRQP